MIRDTSAQDTVVAVAPGGARRRWLRAGILGAIGVAAVASLVAAWANTSHSVNAARLRFAEVERGTLVRDAVVNGRVVAAVSPTLYAPATAIVTLKVKAGDKVKKGDVIAILDSPDLTEELKREQAGYDQLQAEVAHQAILARKEKLAAQRDADQAEIERVSAQRTLERIQNAGELGVVGKIEYMKAQDAVRSADIRSKHAAAAAVLENEDVGVELKTKESQLERQRLLVEGLRRKVDALQMRAPVDGFVGTLSVSDRSAVAINAPIMTLVDLSVLEVELEIPETYLADLGLGMRVEMTVGEAKAVGKLSAISPEVVKNQVLARVRFDGAQPEGLRQSQRVSARLLIEEKPDVLMVARGPFVENEGGRFAYVVEGSTAVRRPIQIGATSVTAVEIVSGAKPGDKLVIAGTDTFSNAQRVSINN
ncbi:MAG TPA: efflux RND transporter periplasmic adaptor subunit [Burkholderiaceae bacterium]